MLQISPCAMYRVYPIKYAHGFALCFVVIWDQFCDCFTHIRQGYITGTGAIIYWGNHMIALVPVT